MTILRKPYRNAALFLLCSLFILSMGAPKTHAAASRFPYIKNIFRKSYHPKGQGWITAPANHAAAAFTTPSFHDFSSKGSSSAVDRKKINFGMCPLKEDFFLGRNAEMASWPSYFGRPDSLLILPPIIGVGGAGKTQIALQLIEQHGAQYDYIVWINATTLHDIQASYHQIAKDLGIKVAPDENLQEVMRLVQEKLKDKNVLYLFDNAPNLRTIQPYFQHGHILITSRNTTSTDWTSSDEDAPLFLAPFSEEAALELAKKMGQDTTDPSLMELIQLLPKYPLVLKQLIEGDTAWRQHSFRYFLDKLKQNTELIVQLNTAPEAYSTYQNTLSYIIESKLEALRSSENGDKYLPLVQQIACLDTHPIPLSFVVLALGQAEEISQVRDMLSVLAKHGLIVWDGYNIHMHGVIQTIIGKRYPLTSKQVANLVDRYVDYDIDKVADAPYPTADFYHQMIPHGEKLLTYVKAQQIDEGYIYSCYDKLIHLYRKQENHKKATILEEEYSDYFYSI